MVEEGNWSAGTGNGMSNTILRSRSSYQQIKLAIACYCPDVKCSWYSVLCPPRFPSACENCQSSATYCLITPNLKNELQIFISVKASLIFFNEKPSEFVPFEVWHAEPIRTLVVLKVALSHRLPSTDSMHQRWSHSGPV